VSGCAVSFRSAINGDAMSSKCDDSGTEWIGLNTNKGFLGNSGSEVMGISTSTWFGSCSSKELFRDASFASYCFMKDSSKIYDGL